MVKRCVICGSEFETGRVSQKCCSKKCMNTNLRNVQRLYRERHKAQRGIFIINCMVCGKEFETSDRRQKICSEECRKKNKKLWQQLDRGRKEKEDSEIMKKKEPKRNTEKRYRLSEVSRMARAEGLTYGQYVAKYGA